MNPNTAGAVEAPVLDETGHFHASDEPVDLSGYAWEDWLTLGIFWLLALDIVYQSVTRAVILAPAPWTAEIPRYPLIIVCFAGPSRGVRKNTHIQVEFIYRWLPVPVARALSTAVDVVRIAFLAYATWLSIDLVPRMHNLKMTVVDFPMSYIYGVVAFGFAMMTFRGVQVAIRHWRQGWSVLERPGEQEA